MAYITREELLQDLADNRTAIQAARKRLQYSVDSGQGKISQQQQSLTTLYKERDRILADLRELDGGGGIVSIEVGR